MLRKIKAKIQAEIITKIAPPNWELHGDRNLQRIFELAVREGKATSLIETGTYLGWTAGYLARKYSDLKVYSCEINEKSFTIAKKRLSKYPNIRLWKGDSPQFLKLLYEKNSLGERPVFFLDAHWEDKWPIEEEIRIIADNLKSAIIFIDDFKINGDNRFKFDSYKDKECSLARVLPFINKKNKYNLLFPNYSYEEAFSEEIPHTDLTGYPVIFQNSSSFFNKLKKEEFVKRYFIDSSKLMKAKNNNL
ncbi:hypothetical protein HYW76_02225 [Candidatus Pacearchaeota archaeon]|nr:hypothetical protein [Candidatus Pacearchaeota archaeon]